MWVKVVIAVFFAWYIGSTFIYRFDPDSLRGKRVIVTGASGGIGEQLAYHYARLGAKVMVVARRENLLKQVVSKCHELGRGPASDYQYFKADLANPEESKKVIEATVSRFGGVDVVTLNHVMLHPLSPWLGSQENIIFMDKAFRVNYHSYVQLASYALPHLEKSAGSIVVMSSVMGSKPMVYSQVYVATKFAINGFFRTLQKEFELSESKISITLCNIALVATENVMKHMDNSGMQMMRDYFPSGNPSDTAVAVVQAGAMRRKEMYYPAMIAWLGINIPDWLTWPIEKLVFPRIGKK